MWMAGYAARTKPAIGKLTELWAKVLMLEDGSGNQAVLVTLDLVGIDRDLSNAIREPLIKEWGFESAQIVVCSSHTHSGPVLWKNLRPLHYLLVDETQQQFIRDYTNSLAPKIVTAAREARAALAPAELSWGSGNTDFAVNRENPEANVPAQRAEGAIVGPSDHEVPVLAVRRPDGTLAAVVFGYACHSTVLDSYRWCGDYPGFAQLELEAAHPDCVALFWAGCGADQNPIPRRSVALARHYGKRLATAVDKILLTTEMEPVAPLLSTQLEDVPIPFESLPDRQQLQKDAQSDNRYTAARAKMLLDQIGENGELDKAYPFPVGAWKLGSEIDFVFLGGETVIDYAIRLKKELRGTRTWVASYSNDVMAYIPSERVRNEGGYEGRDAMVYYGLPANWDAGLEERIIDGVKRVLNDNSEASSPRPPSQERIVVDASGKGFMTADTHKAFTIWGVNYDHNEQSQLIEDY